MLYVGLVIFVALLYMQTDFFEYRFLSTTLLLAVMVLLTVVANVSLNYGKERTAFFVSFLGYITFCVDA